MTVHESIDDQIAEDGDRDGHGHDSLESRTINSKQEIITVYVLRTLVTVLSKAHHSSLPLATSIPSLTSHASSQRSPAMYRPIYTSFGRYQSQCLLGCDAVYFDRRSLIFRRKLPLPSSG